MKYLEPTIKITEFETDDVVTTSGVEPVEGTGIANSTYNNDTTHTKVTAAYKVFDFSY